MKGEINMIYEFLVGFAFTMLFIALSICFKLIAEEIIEDIRDWRYIENVYRNKRR